MEEIAQMSGMKQRPLTAPNSLTWRRLLLWWAERIEETPGDLITIDVSSLQFGQRENFAEVIKATGHLSSSNGTSSLLSGVSESLLVMETIFADTETRAEVLSRIEEQFRMTLQSLASQRKTPGMEALHITYCSVDKVSEFISIAKLINGLNKKSDQFSFLLVPYIHPTNGYPETESGHIDAKRLPNKFYSENAIELFTRARARFEPTEKTCWKRVIRAALDDDDVWAPWGVEEIDAISRQATEELGRPICAVGIASQFVYYPIDGGRIDRAEWRLAMTGSKFFVGNNLEALDRLTPWMLPEAFSSVQERGFRSKGIDLRIVRNSRAFFLYVRTHGNLSGMLKTEHYVDEPMTVCGVGSYHDYNDSVLVLDKQWKENVTREQGYVFEIDPPSLSVRGEYDSQTGELVIRGNFDEFLAKRGLTSDGKKLVVNAGNGKIRFEHEFDDWSNIRIDASTWTERTIARLEDENGERLGADFVRGHAPFLS